MSVSTLPVLSSDSSLSSYIEKVNKFPYLTQDEEVKLAQDLLEKGDINSAHKLVTSHLRLVVKIAMGFRNYGLPVSDLISEGNIGLMQAVKKFDYKKGFRLSTYAMWWVKASIQEYVLHSWSLVKIGTTASQKKLFFNLRKMKTRLNKIDNNDLSPDEISQIAKELNVSKRDVVDMNQRISFSDQSLNSPFIGSEENSGEMIDFLEEKGDGHDLILAERQDFDYKRSLFIRAAEQLNERERDIVLSRYLLEKPITLDDLSKKYNVSRERIRQIEARSMEKLQNLVKNYDN